MCADLSNMVAPNSIRSRRKAKAGNRAAPEAIPSGRAATAINRQTNKNRDADRQKGGTKSRRPLARVGPRARGENGARKTVPTTVKKPRFPAQRRRARRDRWLQAVVPFVAPPPAMAPPQSIFAVRQIIGPNPSRHVEAVSSRGAFHEMPPERRCNGRHVSQAPLSLRRRSL